MPNNKYCVLLFLLLLMVMVAHFAIYIFIHSIQGWTLSSALFLSFECYLYIADLLISLSVCAMPDLKMYIILYICFRMPNVERSWTMSLRGRTRCSRNRCTWSCGDRRCSPFDRKSHHRRRRRGLSFCWVRWTLRRSRCTI